MPGYRNLSCAVLCLIVFCTCIKGDGSCVWPARPCDGDRCVGQQQMCDETADCDDGTDELSAFCTKHDGCQTQCLTAPGNPNDRWTEAACIACCLLDLDSNGFISEQEIHDRFHMCGEIQCPKKDLVTHLTANNVPLCESEMAKYAEFMSGRDGDASVLSLADMHAAFESAGGKNNVPGLPIGGCRAFWKNTVKRQFKDEDCDLTG